MTTGLSSILVCGGTGYLGKFIVRACLKLGHPTYVYGRPITPNTNPSKVELHKEFQSMGVTVFQGELSDHEKLVLVIKQRFVPLDFGVEEDLITEVLPAFQDYLDKKKKIRRATEAMGVPFSFLSSTCFGAYFLSFLLHPHDIYSEELTIYGSGESKVVFTQEDDIAIYVVKVANDPRACNRTVFFRPPKNILSQLELVSLWEKKTGRHYNKVYVSEEEIVKLSKTTPHPDNVLAAITLFAHYL